jgi:CheY-like chemotaxis protein/anti-sigma regulatory factor (Ser/Thr protein kinase)
VLDISKLEVGKIKLVNEPVDLVTLIRESKEIFDWKIKSQDTDVLLEFQEDLDRLFLLDEGRMRQILVNIIGNAVKFTPKGEIRLILEGEKNPDSWDLWIRVKDTGVGIKKDQIERVFEAFHQINPSEYEKNDGTGLGLSLTKGIVELMGGEIHLESELGRGTEVSILIPRVREARDETLVPSEGGNSKDLLEGRILVVDDVSSNRLIVKGLLRDSKKLFVEEAKDGEEGLAKIIGGGFDLVFLDIKMPKMGGDQVVKLVRDHPEFADLPIYALTASTGKDSLSEEFTGFLGKPMNFDDFFKVVSLHLSRGTKGGEERAVAPQPLPSEPVNPDALQELLSYQKKNLSEVKASGDFDRIKDFARKLRSLAEQFDWKALGVYAQQLLTATESFDIKTIRELLEDLPRWSDRWRYE